MNNLSKFLDKFRNINSPNIIKEEIALVIYKKTGIKIDTNKISFIKKTGDVFLNINNFKKTKIFIKKEGILLDLKSGLIKDIK